MRRTLAMGVCGRAFVCKAIVLAALLSVCAPSQLEATSVSVSGIFGGGQSGGNGTAPEPAGLGVPFSAEKLQALLPPAVYFQGRSAPLQLRNAGGTGFGENAVVWAALVDTSGYSTGVQERYQFYLVTEAGLRFGDVRLAAGAYGGGYVGDRFVLMDLGGHVVGEGATEMDTALRRPRPLQMVADQPGSVKLYLGKRWVLLRPDRGTDTK